MQRAGILLSPLMSLGFGILFAVVCILLLHATPPSKMAFPPQLLKAMLKAHVRSIGLQFARDDVTGAPIQRELLEAARAAANEGGAIILAVRTNSSASGRLSSAEQRSG